MGSTPTPSSWRVWALVSPPRSKRDTPERVLRVRLSHSPLMKIKKEDELTKYSHSIDLKLRTGVNVKIHLYKFKCAKPDLVFAGCRHYREDDFWNQAK